jgi:hypothetical protein
MVLPLNNRIWHSSASRASNTPSRERTRIREFARHSMRLAIGLTEGCIQNRFCCVAPFPDVRVVTAKYRYSVDVFKSLTQQFDRLVSRNGGKGAVW